MNVLAGLSFTQPVWWLAALVPLVYLLFAQTLQRARLQAIGSLALWRAALESRSQSAARRAVNWRSLALACAMLVCVAAMAGPRWLPKEGPKRWYLVFGTGAAGLLDAAGATRLDLALREAQAFIEEQRRVDAERQFVFVGALPQLDRRASVIRDELQWRAEPTHVEAPDAAWQAAALAAPERADWAAWDRADCVWFPVGPLEREPVRAGLWNAALPAVPGRIGVRGAEWLDWDGAQIETQAGATPWVWARGAIWQATSDAGRIVEALCEARGWQLVRAGAEPKLNETALFDTDPLLVLWQADKDAAPAGAEPELAQVSGAGWSAEWLLTRARAPVGTTPVGWLRLAVAGDAQRAAPAKSIDRPAEPAVAWAPGLVWTRAAEMGAVSGPLANLVVEWTEVLERALRLPDSSVVPMASRQAREATRRAPEGLPVLPNPTPLGAPVAGVAILLLLLFLRR